MRRAISSTGDVLLALRTLRAIGSGSTSAEDSTALVIPVGQFIGASYDSAEHAFQVRVGPDIVRLNDDQFVIWGLAHGEPHRPLDRPWTTQSVLEFARSRGIADAAKTLVGLLADRLLVEATPGHESAIAFAQSHRMVPLMLGLGNSADDPRVYSVGLPDRPIVSMASMAYDLYEWAHLDPDLWTACTGAAVTAQKAGVTDPIATDAARCLGALLNTAHLLLGPNALYFDTRWEVKDA